MVVILPETRTVILGGGEPVLLLRFADGLREADRVEVVFEPSEVLLLVPTIEVLVAGEADVMIELSDGILLDSDKT